MIDQQQERRERIAAQVLAGIVAGGSDLPWAVDVETAVRISDLLIAELDKTAPQPQSSQSDSGWVVWNDEADRKYPIRDSRGQWLHRVQPWDDRVEAQAVADYLGCRVRRWPLDPAEDKEVQP